MLYLVFGGELVEPQSMTFKDVNNVELTGLYTSRKEAVSMWRGRAQQTVDNAHIRFFIVELGAFGAKDATPPMDEVDEHARVGVPASLGH